MLSKDFHNRIQDEIGKLDDLLVITVVKKRKRRWYGHLKSQEPLAWLRHFCMGQLRNVKERETGEEVGGNIKF